MHRSEIKYYDIHKIRFNIIVWFLIVYPKKITIILREKTA